MENATYYSVLEVTPTDDAWIPKYLSPASKLVAQHGGYYLARTPNHEQLEGQTDAVALRVIIAWPSKEAALGFMNDPEYAPLLKSRTEGSISNHYLIEAKDVFG